MENKIVYKKIEYNVISNVEELLPLFYSATSYNNRVTKLEFTRINTSLDEDISYEYTYSSRCGDDNSEYFDEGNIITLITKGKITSDYRGFYVDKKEAESRVEEYIKARHAKEKAEELEKARKHYAVLKAQFETEEK